MPLVMAWLASLGFSPTARVLLGAWLLTMISVPILNWLWGEKALTAGVTAGVLLQAATVVAILAPAWGAGPTAVTVLLILVLTGRL